MRSLLNLILVALSIHGYSQNLFKNVVIEPIIEKNIHGDYLLSNALLVYDIKDTVNDLGKDLVIISANSYKLNNGRLFDVNKDCYKEYKWDSLSFEDFNKYYLCMLIEGTNCFQVFINFNKGFKYRYHADLNYELSSKKNHRKYIKECQKLGIKFSGNVYLIKGDIKVTKFEILL